VDEAILKKQKLLAIVGLVLALPFPILITILWITLNNIKGQATGLDNNTMNTVFLYLVQFFLIPLLSLGSIILACIATMKTDVTVKRIGYAALTITGIGFIVLGLFLNNS